MALKQQFFQLDKPSHSGARSASDLSETASNDFRLKLRMIHLMSQLLELNNERSNATEKLKYIHRIQETVKEMSHLLDDCRVIYQPPSPPLFQSVRAVASVGVTTK